MRHVKFLHLLVCTALLVACSTRAQAKKQIAEVKDTISSLPQSEIIIEQLDDASGNQNDCIGAMYTLVYGSQQMYDDIIAYYQTELTERGWVDKSSEYGEPVFIKGHRLGIAFHDKDIEKAYMFTDEEAVKSLLETRAPEFQTFFLVEIVFSTCLKW